MEQKIKFFENCTLLQACEWIAYKIPPMEEIRARAQGFKRGVLLPEKTTGLLYEMMTTGRPNITQYDKDYSEKIWDAAAKLELAIYDGDITVYGDVSGYENAQQLLEIATTGKRPMLGARFGILEKKFVQIKNITSNLNLDLHNNTLNVNGIEYADVYIPFKELRTAFHNTHAETAFNAIESRYSTPYMEIMAEVINEFKITNTNQPLKKILTDAIMKKMNEYGLRPSQSLAEYMATVIRLPESQKGHA